MVKSLLLRYPSWRWAALLMALTVVGKTSAQPVLRAMQPFALKRGVPTKVRFNGEKLAGTYRALVYEPGWQDADWNIREDGLQATAVVTVASDCDRGWHCLRLCSNAGISGLVTFYVSDDKPIAESRNPHREDAPQEIPAACLLAGTLQLRDVDVYAIQLQQGQRISAEVQGLRVGRALFDPQLELLGPDGGLLAACDDTSLTRQDPYLSLVAPAAGRYLLRVTESQHTGNPGFWYLLHLGAFPRPSIARQLGGPPKSQLQLTWLNPDGPMFDQPVTLCDTAADLFPVFPTDAWGSAPTPVYLRVNDLPVVEEAEPNGAKNPQPVPVPVAIHGIVQQDRDDDLFRVTVTKGQVLDIRALARDPHRSPLDAVLGIRRSDNSYLTSNDDANGSPDSYLRFTFPEDGDYFILIRDQLGRGQPDMAYRLEIQPPVPKLSLTCPEWQQNVSPTLAVPGNNRMALLVNLNRQDASGEVVIRAEDTPTHVSMAEAHVPADRYQVPVLFEADAEANPSGALISLVGDLTDGTGHIPGRLSIRHRLVSGRNNVEMLATTLDHLAMVVTDPVPVMLQIVQPRVPLVRSGSMNLRVQAVRSGDFRGPIILHMLHNPNGVSTQWEAVIPEGQTEATLTMTANGAAQLGTWPIVVVGNGDLSGRRFDIATQLAQLEIADTFFDLAFVPTAVEQAAGQRFAVGITVKQAFEGEGSAELLGLPPGVTAAPVAFTADSKSLEFEVQAAEDARLGRFEGISCRLTFHVQEEPIVHILGAGSLRVDPRPKQPATSQQTSRRPVSGIGLPFPAAALTISSSSTYGEGQA